MSSNNSPLKFDEIKHQIDENQKKSNSAEFPNLELIKAKVALDNSEVGQACFHMGQYLENNKNQKNAMRFYITGADDYHNNDCQTKLEGINTLDKFSLVDFFDVVGLILAPVWMLLEFVFRSIYQNTIKRPVKYLILIRTNRLVNWLLFICICAILFIFIIQAL